MNIKRKLFIILISVYPKSYRAHFKVSLLQTFDDMHEDTSVSDWFVFRDTVVSIPMQYINYFEETMKTKFRNIPVAIVGVILILPFVALMLIAMIARLFQNLGFQNSLNGGVSQIIGSHINIGVTVVVLFPLFAFLVNLIALIWSGWKDRELTVKQFVAGNVFSIVIMFAGLLLVAFVPLHDAVPCFVRGVSQGGFNNILQLMRACQNA